MTGDGFAMELAAAFTAGCITILALRKHAHAVTPVLTVIVICLGLFTGLVAMAS